MIISIILLIFSFLLEKFMTNYLLFSLNNISIFTTIYTIITLVVIYPCFSNKKKYFLLVIIFGFLFDIVYTNTFLLNTFIFFVVLLINKILNYSLTNNLIGTIIKSIIAISVYHILTYLILIIINYTNYPIMLLLKILYSSLIMTVVYSILIYIITKKLLNKISIK